MRLRLKDRKAFERAINHVRQRSKRTSSEIVNKALRDVGYWAMSFTPFRTADYIEAELKKDDLVWKLTAKRLVAAIGRGSKNIARKSTGTYSRARLAAQVKRTIAKRRQGSRALRAGWIPAIRQMGGGLRSDAKLRKGSTASKGFAVKATPFRLRGQITNMMTTILSGGKSAETEGIATAALIRAIRHKTADLMNYGKREMTKTLRRSSDR